MEFVDRSDEESELSEEEANRDFSIDGLLEKEEFLEDDEVSNELDAELLAVRLFEMEDALSEDCEMKDGVR